MRLRSFVVALAVVSVVSAGCAPNDRSESCPRTDRSADVEDALQELEHLADDEDTNLNNVDTRLEQLGEDVNNVMNTTDDPSALQPSDADLSFDDLRASIEDLGNADDLSQTGDALDDALSQLGDAVERMSKATEDCTP
jgi:DNA repair ATPase RecN